MLNFILYCQGRVVNYKIQEFYNFTLFYNKTQSNFLRFMGELYFFNCLNEGIYLFEYLWESELGTSLFQIA